jgi:NRAMP (natural resistance-associated macrophage protein)-like metal ion transporter
MVAFSRRANWVFWIVAEAGAMVTNLAEFLGSTLGLYLLFNIPMMYAGFITAAITFFICHMEKYGQRVVERIITALVAFPSPNYCVHTIMHHLSDYGGMRYEMGYASAIATLLFFMMIGANLLVTKMLRKVGT